MHAKLNKWDCIIDPILKNNVQIGGLFIGDIDCAQNPDLFKSLRIGALLSVIDEPYFSVPSDIIHEVFIFIFRMRINVPDCSELNLSEYFPKTHDFIDRHRQHTNVMVHCYAGISRSATVVIAYIMNKFQWGYQRTLNTVVSRRRQVKPNSGFIKQLMAYEHQNKNRPSSQQNRILSTINNVISRYPCTEVKQPQSKQYDQQSSKYYDQQSTKQSSYQQSTYFKPTKLDLTSLEIEIAKRQKDLQNLRSKYNELSNKVQSRANSVYVSQFD